MRVYNTGDSLVCGIYENLFKPLKLCGSEAVVNRYSIRRSVGVGGIVLIAFCSRIPVVVSIEVNDTEAFALGIVVSDRAVLVLNVIH